MFTKSKMNAINAKKNGNKKKEEKEKIVTKSEFVQHIAVSMAKSHKEVKDILDVMLATIVREVAAGKTITFREFGKFEPRRCMASTRINPKTGEKMNFPEQILPGFKPDKTFMEICQKSPAFRTKIVTPREKCGNGNRNTQIE